MTWCLVWRTKSVLQRRRIAGTLHHPVFSLIFTQKCKRNPLGGNDTHQAYSIRPR